MLQENCPHDPNLQFEEYQITNNSPQQFDANFNIQAELDNLKEIILSSSRIPLTELVIIDEDLLLERLLYIQENLPAELTIATEIVNQRQEIIADAQGYACLIVKSAEEKAHQIVQESAIVRQAELDGARIRLKTEQECEQLMQNTLSECQAIQKDADQYTDSALEDLENRLKEMIIIVQNGRSQLEQ